MILINTFKSFIFSFLILFFFLPIAYAQQNNTMYFMKGIPQSQMFNPATQPKCEVFVGLPGISSIGVALANNALDLNDIMYYSEAIDSTVFALHPREGDEDEFLRNFKKKNFFSQQTNINIITFGFRSDDFFYTFSYNIKLSARFLYPKDIMRFYIEGDEYGHDFDFSSFRADATAYQEFGFGVSNMLNPYLSVGANAKILFGLANATQRNTTDLRLTTNPFVWPFDVAFDNNINIPFSTVKYDGDHIYNVDFEDFDSLSVSDYMKNAFSNFGLGLDLGAHYTIDDLTLSASIIDLGFIRWKSNPYNMKQDAHFDILGGNIPLTHEGFPDMDSILDVLVDSLDNNLNVHKGTKAAYTTALPAKIYLGATYRLTPQIQVGILSRSEFFKKKLYQQLTISTSFWPDKVMSPTITYSMMNKSYNNFGLGFSLRLYYLQFYFITDNFPLLTAREKSTGWPIPHKMKSVSVHFGLNLVFGCNKMKKLLNDQPIIQ